MQTNLILLVVCLVLGVFTTTTLINERSTFTEYDTIPRLFPGFTEDNIQYILITKAKADAVEQPPVEPGAAKPPAPVEKLVLMRNEDGWVIGETSDHRSDLAGVPVRETQVETSILDHIKSIRRDEKALYVADASDETMAQRGLTQETGTLIECLNAERVPTVELWVGKAASGENYGQNSVPGYCVARKGQNDIILYEPANRYWDVPVDPKNWIDNNIHTFETDDVRQFSVKNPKGEFTLVREQVEGQPLSPWKAEAPGEGVGAVKQDEVERLLARFTRVACSRYLGDVRRPEFAGKVPDEKNAEYIVSATLADGSVHTMWVGKKIEDKAELYARFADSKGPSRFLVAIGDWVKSPFELDPQTLFDPPAEAVGPGEEKDEEAPAPNEPPDPEKKSGGEGAGNPDK